MYKTTMCIYSLPTWLQKPRIELGFAGYEPTVLPLHYSAILLVEDVGAAPLLQLPKMVCYCYTTSSIPWYFISDLTAIPLYNFTRENFVKRKERGSRLPAAHLFSFYDHTEDLLFLESAPVS